MTESTSNTQGDSWGQGYYTFQFSYLDREGKERFDVLSINDPVGYMQAVEIAQKHGGEYGEYRIQWLVKNEHIRTLLSKERAEGERRLDTYFQFIKQTGKMHEFVKWEEARTLPADSREE
jgi:hypothetical protein